MSSLLNFALSCNEYRKATQTIELKGRFVYDDSRGHTLDFKITHINNTPIDTTADAFLAIYGKAGPMIEHPKASSRLLQHTSLASVINTEPTSLSIRILSPKDFLVRRAVPIATEGESAPLLHSKPNTDMISFVTKLTERDSRLPLKANVTYLGFQAPARSSTRLRDPKFRVYSSVSDALDCHLSLTLSNLSPISKDEEKTVLSERHFSLDFASFPLSTLSVDAIPPSELKPTAS